ncbi:hypothetical protein [Desulfobacula sp.]|uniref:hypothetical protein n=1 Tax=Desulfobacula sp. TaxID=2593537 RepID=UPI0025BB9A84|nr:hypothetical protein [Desulfobacula sp.]MBC2705140.1 hypothetical protein [Desulfobacula sp.]
MRGLDLNEALCELLGGFFILLSIIPILDINGTIAVKDTFIFLSKNLSLSLIGAVIILSYLLGLIMDVIGLGLGELFVDDFLCKDCPSFEETESFWRNVPEHVLKYRDKQWAYYSAYRNLAILIIPCSFLWGIVFFEKLCWQWVIILVFLFLIYWALKRTSSVLLKIYYNITKVFNEKNSISSEDCNCKIPSKNEKRG